MNVYTDNNLTPAPWMRDALRAETAPDAFFPEPYDRHTAAALREMLRRPGVPPINVSG